MNRILVSIMLTMGFAYSLSAQEKDYFGRYPPPMETTVTMR